MTTPETKLPPAGENADEEKTKNKKQKEEKPETVVNVHKIALDATPEHKMLLRRYANAYRCTYNYGQRLKLEVYEQWAKGRDVLVEQGMSRDEAKKKAPKVKSPGAFEMTKVFRANRDNGEIHYKWWHGVSENMCCQAFTDVDRAWKNWFAGRTGFPRFKRKGRGGESFRTQSAKLPDPRHLTIPGGGGQKAFTMRLYRPATKLFRDLNRGGKVGAVTVSRVGNRWFASVNVRMPKPAAVKPDKNQRAAGTVGLDLRVAVLAATSAPVTVRGTTESIVENPKHLEQAERTLKRWQRRAARRYQKGFPTHRQSKGWHEAQDHVRRLHALVAARRADTQHHLTKALTTQFAHIVIEDLSVKQMTKSAKGTVDKPGKHVAHKSRLNKAVLGVGFGEIRRQIEYKAPRYGATVTVVDPSYTSQTCSKCHHVSPRSHKNIREFVCVQCGHKAHGAVEAAREIRRRGSLQK